MAWLVILALGFSAGFLAGATWAGLDFKGENDDE